MNSIKWHLFTIRTQIEMRMNQIGLSPGLRMRIVCIIAKVTDIPRLTNFARRLEAKEKRIPNE
jgi:hypothetical protein